MQARMTIRVAAVLLVLGAMTSQHTTTALAGYFAVGAGYGGEGDNGSISVESGETGIDFSDLDMLMGLGLPIIPYGNTNLPADTIATECPHDDCVGSSIEYKGTELGVYAKIGLQVFLDNLYLNVIGGATVVTESEIVQSPSTGLYYENSSESTINALYGAGLAYFPEIFDWPLAIQIDIDNRRGVTGLVGWYW